MVNCPLYKGFPFRLIQLLLIHNECGLSSFGEIHVPIRVSLLGVLRPTLYPGSLLGACQLAGGSG